MSAGGADAAAGGGAAPIDADAIADAAAVIRRGGLVAFPTETVYGLGADALDEDAVARIFAAKGRPAFNPVIVHVPDAAAARALAAEWPPVADRLAAACWPGPLTLVVRRAAAVPDVVTAGRDTVGVRVPAHPVALALLRASGRPIAAPSANRYTRTSPTTAAHVRAALGDRVDRVLDGGPTNVGIESTVLDVTTTPPTVLRSGTLTRAELEAAAGEAVRVHTAGPGEDAGETPRPAPGMTARHYAPDADVWLFGASEADEVARALAAEPRPTGAILVHAELATAASARAGGDGGDAPMLLVHRLPPEPAAYARALYAALHALDAAGCARIVIERPPAGEAWDGIRDRLERASR